MRSARPLFELLSGEGQLSSEEAARQGSPGLFDLLSESLQWHRVRAGCLEVHRLLSAGMAPGGLPKGMAAHALDCDLCLLRLARDLPWHYEHDLPDRLLELADDLSPLLAWRVQAVERRAGQSANQQALTTREEQARQSAVARALGESVAMAAAQEAAREAAWAVHEAPTPPLDGGLIGRIAHRDAGAEQACFAHLRGHYEAMTQQEPGRRAMGPAHLELVMLIRSGVLSWTSAEDLYQVFERILLRHLENAREAAHLDRLADVLSLERYRGLIQERRAAERAVNQRMRQIQEFRPSGGDR